MKVAIEPYNTRIAIRWEEPEKFYEHCVGRGWLPLLLKLTSQLEFLGWNGKLAQVKEKFGTLRFYWNNNCEGIKADIAEACVREAEHMSAQTCENCGKYGTLRGSGWVYTSCAKCVRYPDDLKEWEKPNENQ